MRKMVAAAVLTALGSPAAAHVVISPSTATAGGYYAGELRVSHGCDGSPTLALRVDIPQGVISAKPQPKPGWTLSIEREPLAAPLRSESGAMVRDRAKTMTWRGRLPDDQFDTFGLMLRLPPQAGPLMLPVVQTCERSETRWVEPIVAGEPRPPHPAPVLTLLPGSEPERVHAH